MVLRDKPMRRAISWTNSCPRNAPTFDGTRCRHVNLRARLFPSKTDLYFSVLCATGAKPKNYSEVISQQEEYGDTSAINFQRTQAEVGTIESVDYVG
jgi:hypothetical protein